MARKLAIHGHKFRSFFHCVILADPIWAHGKTIDMPVRMHFLDCEKGQMILRKTNDETDLQHLQNRIENYYFALRHNDLEFSNYKPGDFCAVKVYRTQQWWRGEIIGNVNHETIGDAVRVRLVDKGRNTIVAKQNIKQLASCFNQIPMLSVAVRLADMKYAAPFTENARAAIKKFFEESCITMNVVRTPIDRTSPYAVNLYNKRQVSLRLVFKYISVLPSFGNKIQSAFSKTKVKNGVWIMFPEIWF